MGCPFARPGPAALSRAASGALAWCPFPDAEAAREIARRLLDDGLIACANLVPGMHSLYIWNGERGEAEECGALFKTEAALLDRVIARIVELHPYEEPAVLAWRCDAAGAGTLAWLGELQP